MAVFSAIIGNLDDTSDVHLATEGFLSRLKRGFVQHLLESILGLQLLGCRELSHMWRVGHTTERLVAQLAGLCLVDGLPSHRGALSSANRRHPMSERGDVHWTSDRWTPPLG